ncbi:hypothetical protein [Kibdelosporangium philippinense]
MVRRCESCAVRCLSRRARGAARVLPHSYLAAPAVGEVVAGTRANQ